MGFNSGFKGLNPACRWRVW